MSFTERSFAATALLLATLFVPACSLTQECSSKGATSILLRADQACPSASEAQAREDSGTAIDSKARPRVSIQARVICWYRSKEAPGITPCFWGTRATMLADAMRPDQTGDVDQSIYASDLLSCDAEGSLYGQAIFVPEANAGDALPATPVECPAQVAPAPTAAYALIAVTTFVGSDSYPALVACEYDTIESFPCALNELRH